MVNLHNHGVIATSRTTKASAARRAVYRIPGSDDVWYPDKLVRCVAALETGCDLVCHGEMWSQDGVPPRRIVYGPAWRAQYSRMLYRGNCISTSATVIRKALLDRLGGFSEDPAMVTAEDYDLWLRIARNTNRLCFIPKCWASTGFMAPMRAK